VLRYKLRDFVEESLSLVEMLATGVDRDQMCGAVNPTFKKLFIVGVICT
jgi:hypothetical protein